MSSLVRITDVSPRDGLQNEPRPVPTASKARLVDLLLVTGVDEIEATSFVSPKWIPQLGDAEDLLESIAPSYASAADPPLLSALVPNERGLERLLAVNDRHHADVGRPLVGKVSGFTAASETFSERNTNASVAQTLERFVPIFKRASDLGLPVRAYISCAIACPFEGPVRPEVVAQLSEDLHSMGADEIDIGDTIGAATPDTTATLVDALGERINIGQVTLHLHDTLGLAGACVDAALDAGVRSFDAAAGGLGGCPYASTAERRAPGNIAMAKLLDAIEAKGLMHPVRREPMQLASTLAVSLASEELA